jgi:hypothetical protein
MDRRGFRGYAGWPPICVPGRMTIARRPCLPITLIAAALAVAGLAAAPEFKSIWKSPDAAEVSFAGKKLAALVITQDDGLRVAGEESLASELTARGLQAVPTYRFAPKEELLNAERARGWFEKAAIEGVVALRPLRSEQRLSYDNNVWLSTSYNTFWNYYGYGWTTVTPIGAPSRDELITVESLIYSVPRNQLLWAAVSETRNPKSLQQFVDELVKESVNELRKQGLARTLPKR